MSQVTTSAANNHLTPRLLRCEIEVEAQAITFISRRHHSVFKIKMYMYRLPRPLHVTFTLSDPKKLIGNAENQRVKRPNLKLYTFSLNVSIL